MKQKKIGDILYVYSTTAYEITEDTDATVIKIQEECIPAYAALNASLVSKFSPINYKLFCVKHPEWADYMNDYTVTIDTITGGTVTASPTSGDEGEEITLTQEASTGYEFVSWDVEDGEGDPITVTDNKFLMPASNVTVGATFDKIDFDITVDDTIQNGSLSAPETANLGDTVTITATPASGYVLDTLTVMCGSLEITVVNNQFTMPAGDVTITGTFVLQSFEIICMPTTNGTVSAPASAQVGSTVTITTTPDSGYDLDTLTVVGGTSGSSVTVTNNQFVMPAEAVTVNATFVSSGVAIHPKWYSDSYFSQEITSPVTWYSQDYYSLNLYDNDLNIAVTDQQGSIVFTSSLVATWESSDPSVVTIEGGDSDAMMRVVTQTVGTAIVTATWPAQTVGGVLYAGGSASITIEVES